MQVATIMLISILGMLRYDIPYCGRLSSVTSSGKNRLNHINELGKQIEYKIEKIVEHLPKVKNFIKKSWKNDARVRASFVRYKDAIWMMIYDILIGIISSLLLVYYYEEVFAFTHIANDFLTNSILKTQISWLMVHLIT